MKRTLRLDSLGGRRFQVFSLANRGCLRLGPGRLATSQRDPSSARHTAPHLGRDDHEKRKTESKATAKAAQLKLAATGANTFARRDGPGSIGLGEILRCAQDDNTGWPTHEGKKNARRVATRGFLVTPRRRICL